MKITIELAGMPMELIVDNNDVFECIKREWKRFTTKNVPFGRINVTAGYTDGKLSGVVESGFHFSGGVYTSNNRFSGGSFDFRSGTGSVNVMINKNRLYGLSRFLVPIWSIFLLHKQKLLMHACGVEKSGQGYMFSGPQQSGKSTIAQKSSKYHIFGDEIIILSLKDDSVVMSPTMLEGEYLARKGEEAALKKIYFIEHGNRLTVKKMTDQEKFYSVMKNSFPFMLFEKKSPEVFRTLFKLASHYSLMVDCYRLTSRKEDDVWEVIK